jgi:chorismate mutase
LFLEESGNMDEGSFKEHRARIDSLDEQILALLNQRIGIASELGILKAGAGLAVVDAEREGKVLRRVARLNRGPLDQGSVLRIFGAIIEAARRAQLRAEASRPPAGTESACEIAGPAQGEMQ